MDVFGKSEMTKPRPLVEKILYINCMIKSASNVKENIKKLFETNINKNLIEDYK